ncbi:Putative exported protein precursor [Candidatus Sodalis pierantonius str. SOPE]|uniref:Putative exported protein n=1 Tax=Candidatus Sodalis pierantonii str. SOPE TaxID=2342 RepID=W0HNY8_9GAMM|nr:YebY family protein [Candidatus Sodalis pierantonius]AHF73838.1 Putative exported protein precursor [Candidatus Sodalis pierantonius str. SOPE]
MKKRSVVVVLVLLASQYASAMEIITLSKFQYGKQWAFTKEEVQLMCRPNHALCALNMSTLMQYPLNEQAEQQRKEGHVHAQPIDTILLDDPDRPGQKMSIAPFVERAQQLCVDKAVP